MKKRTRIFAALAAVLLLMIPAGCAGESPVSQPASSAVSEEPPMKLNENGKFDSLQDFIESDILKTQVQNIQASVKEAGMTLEIAAEGDTLIYLFTVADVPEDSVKGLGEQLSKGLESQKETYQAVAASLRDASEVKDPRVRAVYRTEDGTELCSREFSAE